MNENTPRGKFKSLNGNSVAEATILVLREMLGSDKALEDLMDKTSGHCCQMVAYHVLQSNMYFAKGESGDTEEEILEGWDKAIDPQMSSAWHTLQSWYWSP